MPARVDGLDRSLIERLRLVRLAAFDFDGVFTDNAVYVSQDGTEAVRCVRSDGLGLQRLSALGVATVVISTETNPAVSARSRKLEVRCIQGCLDKRTALEGFAAELGLTLQETAFVGNDINDLDCLRAVGLPIVVADAHEDVLPHAVYRTRTPGGHGAVREVCDLIAAARHS
jgi:YrbI family 3-deoxy-D-manno-octulosonate 8-phosphate phosphatase